MNNMVRLGNVTVETVKNKNGWNALSIVVFEVDEKDNVLSKKELSIDVGEALDIARAIRTIYGVA